MWILLKIQWQRQRVNNQFLINATFKEQVWEKNLVKRQPFPSVFRPKTKATSLKQRETTRLLVNRGETDVNRITMNHWRQTKSSQKLWSTQSNSGSALMKLALYGQNGHIWSQVTVSGWVRRSRPPAAAPPRPPCCVSGPPAGESSPTWREGGTTPHKQDRCCVWHACPQVCLTCPWGRGLRQRSLAGSGRPRRDPRRPPRAEPTCRHSPRLSHPLQTGSTWKKPRIFDLSRFWHVGAEMDAG